MGRLPPENEAARDTDRLTLGRIPSPFGFLDRVVPRERLWPKWRFLGRAPSFANLPTSTDEEANPGHTRSGRHVASSVG
jgi:hypothetical protein